MVKSTYLSEKSSDFDEPLYQILHPMTDSWRKIEMFIIQDGSGFHLENSFFDHNSSTDCLISAKFCTSKQNGMLVRPTGQKLQIFKIQDGGRLPFWKWLNHHISVKNCPILLKVGVLHHIFNPMTATWPKTEIFKIQDGGSRHLKIAFLAINHWLIVRFQRNFVWGSRTACWRGLRDKNCKFLKSKMADGRHFENR